MIRNFSDHAANERTFLAWVRTAIAVMAFGFLVARFNLFLRIAAQSRPGGAGPVTAAPGGAFGNAAGLALIVVGTGMVAVAAVRFIRTSRAIDSPEQLVDGARMDLSLAGLMVALGIALVLYLSHAVLPAL
jgi:putative membrane protein